MVTRVALAVLATALAAVGSARADNGKLAEARAAIDAVHYPDAQRLLGEALESGGSSPAEVAEIYRLSASTAAALGHAEIAEQFYRRWLALDPHASLAAGESPKLQVPFAAARAYIQAHGGLVVHVDRDSAHGAGHELAITVVADPLAMAAAATRGNDAPVGFDGNHQVDLADGPGPVAILDDRGNHLVELDVPVAPVRETPVPRPSEPAPAEPTGWKVWAVGAGVFTAVAVGFGITAVAYASEATDAVEHSGDHFVSDVFQARDRSRLFAYISAGAMAVGIGFAIPAAHYYPNSLRALVTTSGVAIAGGF